MTTAIDGSKPLNGSITYISETVNSITVRIAANSVSSTVTNIPILIQMNSRSVASDSTLFDAVFDELIINWQKLYVKDSTVSQSIYIDTWDVDNKFARVWVILDSLTTAQKDLVIEFDTTDPDNTDAKWIAIQEPRDYYLLDEFTATNGDSYNTDNWIDYTDPSTGTITTNIKEIQSNQLYTEHATSNGAWIYSTIGVESNYELSGDFDIEVEYDSSTMVLSNSGCFGGIYTNISGGGDNDAIFILRTSTNLLTRVGGTSGTSSSIGDDSALRITRVGTTGTIYSLSVTDTWTSILTGTVSSNNMYVRLLNRAVNESGVAQKFYFDNFKVKIGTMV